MKIWVDPLYKYFELYRVNIMNIDLYTKIWFVVFKTCNILIYIYSECGCVSTAEILPAFKLQYS